MSARTCYQIWALGSDIEGPRNYNVRVPREAIIYLDREEAVRNQAKFDHPTYLVEYKLQD